MSFELIAANLSIFTNNIIIIVIYINDILLASPDKAEIQRIKNKLHNKFEITNLRPYIYYLDITVTKDRVNRILRLNQKGYIKKFLKEYSITSSTLSLTLINNNKFHITKDNFTSIDQSRYIYQFTIKLLIYVILSIRFDIAFAILVIFRYTFNPDKSH